VDEERERAVDDRQRKAYWRRNVRLIGSLLAVWFVVSYGFGILLVEQLNAIGNVFGAPLGFWFAQQGSIITFVVLILVYALRMDRLDDEFGVSERDEQGRRV
jgi:putative solute:sodium symporter small subunit